MNCEQDEWNKYLNQSAEENLFLGMNFFDRNNNALSWELTINYFWHTDCSLKQQQQVLQITSGSQNEKQINAGKLNSPKKVSNSWLPWSKSFSIRSSFNAYVSNVN
jgi:hypothetical protein